MLAPLRCPLSHLAIAFGGLLLTGSAGAAIVVTGLTSPAIPPAGVGQSYSAPGELSIGIGPLPAIVTVDRTSVLSGGSVTVGSIAGTIGQVSVFNRGAKLEGRTGGLTVGGAGNGWVTATDGAVLEFATSGGAVILGDELTGVGRLAVSDPGTALIVGERLLVGRSGYGEFDLSNGALSTVFTDLLVASPASGRFGGAGVVRVDGAGTRLIVSRDVRVGDLGYGELYLTAGASLQVAEDFNVGGLSGVGNVTVAGQRTRLSVGESLSVGSIRGFNGNAGGLLTIADGAIVNVDQRNQGEFMRVLQDGRLEMDGGTLLTSSLIVDGTLSGDGVVFGPVTVGSQPGARVEVHQGQHLQFASQQTTQATGDFYLAGGHLELLGSLDQMGGDITLRDGAVLDTDLTTTTGVIAAISGVSDVYGDTTTDNLVIAQDTTLVFHDALNVGSGSVIVQPTGSLVSLANLTLTTGSLSGDPGSSLSMTLKAPGETGDVVVTGQMTLAGSLSVEVPTAVDSAAQAGDVFTLITAGSLVGGFGSLDLPSLSDGLFLSPRIDATSFALEVVDSLPADFNLDGLVDAADYTMLRDGMGSAYSEEDRITWASYFGTSLAAPATSVPEPTAALVALLGLVGGFGFRRTA